MKRRGVIAAALASGALACRASVATLAATVEATPLTIGSLACHLTDDPATITLTATNTVSAWRCLYGGATFAQTTASKQPPAEMVGRFTARFNGGQALSAGDALDIGATSATIIIAVRRNSSADGALFAKSLAGAAAGRFAIYRSSGATIAFVAPASGTLTTSPTDTTDTRTMSAYALTIDNQAGGYLRYWRDWTNIGSATGAAIAYTYNTATRFLIGAYNNATDTGEAAGVSLVGNVAGMTYHRKLLTTGETAALTAYYKQRFGTVP